MLIAASGNLLFQLYGKYKTNNMKKQDFINNIPGFKYLVYMALGACAILLVFFIRNKREITTEETFIPYATRVTSFYIDNQKYCGKYYQYIEFETKDCMIANGFSAIINGQKTLLIDYIAIGDSVVQKKMSEVYIYRNGSDTFKFTFNSEDFK